MRTIKTVKPSTSQSACRRIDEVSSVSLLGRNLLLLTLVLSLQGCKRSGERDRATSYTRLELERFSTSGLEDLVAAGNDAARPYLARAYIFGIGAGKSDSEKAFSVLFPVKDNTDDPMIPYWYARSLRSSDVDYLSEKGFDKEKIKEQTKLALDRAWKAGFFNEDANIDEIGGAWASELGYCYIYEFEFDKDYEKGLKWIRAATAVGDQIAPVRLGRCYARAWGVEQNLSEAEKWWRRAGKSKAEIADLFHATATSERKLRNHSSALKLYRRAAEDEHLGALTMIGFMYDQGQGVPEDDVQAMSYFQRAAKSGHPIGMANVGIMHQHGKGVPVDLVEARRWYEAAGAAGRTNAMYRLGVMILDGKEWPETNWDSIEARQEDAAVCLTKAANDGDIKAMKELGFRLWNGTHGGAVLIDGKNIESGKYGGLPFDFEEAVKWYARAAERGDAEAVHVVSSILLTGDKPTTVSWESDRRTSNYLGVDAGLKYMKNSSMTRSELIDEDRGIEFLEKGAQRMGGDLWLKLGKRWLSGADTLDPDPAKALSAFENGANEGCSDCMMYLAELHALGKKFEHDGRDCGQIKSDPTEARRWFSTWLAVVDQMGTEPGSRGHKVRSGLALKGFEAGNSDFSAIERGARDPHIILLEPDGERFISMTEAIIESGKESDQESSTLATMFIRGVETAIGGKTIILIPRDFSRGLKLLEEAAEKGQPLAFERLLRIHTSGYEGLQDLAKSEAYFRQGWKQKIEDVWNEHDSLDESLYMHFGSEGFWLQQMEFTDRAILCLEKSLQYEGTNAFLERGEVMTSLARCYLRKKRHKDAIRLLTKALDLKKGAASAFSHFVLSECYRDRSWEGDRQRAFSHLIKASNGDLDYSGVATYRLGDLINSGDGRVTMNGKEVSAEDMWREGLTEMERAVMFHGNSGTSGDNLHYLGLAAFKGRGRDRSMDDCIKWWEKGGEMLHLECIDALILIYGGDGGLDDADRHAHWVKKRKEVEVILDRLPQISL